MMGVRVAVVSALLLVLIIGNAIGETPSKMIFEIRIASYIHLYILIYILIKLFYHYKVKKYLGIVTFIWHPSVILSNFILYFHNPN